MIVFERLFYKNFLQTGKTGIEIVLNECPLTGIVGHNGAGKSTLEDAICFALYGKAFRKVNKSQLVNSINKKNCLVELEFSVDGTRWKVTRGISPNVFHMERDGVVLDNMASDRDMQRYLTDVVLGMSENTFRQIVILGSKSYIPFMRLPASSRREVIESLFDIGVLTRMHAVLKEDMKDQRKIDADLSSAIDRLAGILETKREHNEKVIGSGQELIDEKEDEIAQNEAIVESLEVVIGELQRDVSEITVPDVSRAEKLLSKANSALIQLKSKRDRLSKDLSFYRENESCPTCKRPWEDNNLQDCIGEQLNEVILAIDGLQTKIGEFEMTINESRWLKEKVDEIEGKISEAQSEVNRRNQFIERCRNEIERVRALAGQSLVPLEELRELEQQIESKRKERKTLHDLMLHYSTIERMLKDGSIRAKIVEQYLPVINGMIGKYLKAMEFDVDFQFDSDFNETIQSHGRKQFTYDSFSDGQKARIDFALLMAFRGLAKQKNSVQTNLLILDEVGDSSLDHDGFELLMGILQEENSNMFVISHRPELLYDAVDRLMLFKREGSFTQVEVKMKEEI